MKALIRVDGQSDDNVIRFCSKEMTVQYVIVSHVLPNNKNPHHHFYIDDQMSMSVDAIRAKVKRFFKVDNRSDYSVKKYDRSKETNEFDCIRYMFNTKHGNEWKLVSVRGFDDEFITSCQKDAQVLSEEYELKTRIRDMKKDQVTIWQLSQELADMVDANHLDRKDIVRIEEYTRYAIQICYKHKRTCEFNMLNKIISTAMARTENGKNLLVQKMQNYFKEM